MHPILSSPAALYANLSSIDKHFANFLSRTAFNNLAGEESEKSELSHDDQQKLVMLFARLSQVLGQQNSCLEILDFETQVLLKRLSCVTAIQTADVSQHEDCKTPLVLIEQSQGTALLYSNRFYQYERRIAQSLIARNRSINNSESHLSALTALFTEQDDPRQKMAAIIAATRQLAIISGGPGTGKTSTVVKILGALLINQPDLRIQLAAPTGKAAMRLTESIKSESKKLQQNLADHQRIEIPSQVSTLHRLLRVRADGQSYHYHKTNLLPVDVLILDEASMIDLVMFDRILQALPPHARLVILGDSAQLPSVDVGTVLFDITRQGEHYSAKMIEQIKGVLGSDLPNALIADLDHLINQAKSSTSSRSLLMDAHCMLKTSYRFKDDDGIGQLAHLLRGHSTSGQSGLSPLSPVSPVSPVSPEVSGPANFIAPLEQNSNQVQTTTHFDQKAILGAMTSIYQNYINACQNPSVQAAELLDLFDSSQLLTPLREGEFGVVELNAQLEKRLYPNAPYYYHGKPIMVMKNHYNLRLFNGDIGICVQRGDKIEVAFRNSQGEYDYYLPARLPQHETCYAMTVHKSQGSEFDNVCLVLPETDREDFVNRELIYTGVTRAKQRLLVFGQVIANNLGSNTRISGLANMLQTGVVPHEVSGSSHDTELEPNSENASERENLNQNSNSNDQLHLF